MGKLKFEFSLSVSTQFDFYQHQGGIPFQKFFIYIVIMALRGSARLTGAGASASSQASSQASQVTQASTYRVSRALCSVCSRCMPVTGAGVLRVHGPLSNRCAGYANGANGQDPTPVPGPFPSESLLQLFRRTSTSVKVVKRIPRASRHFAATKLAHVLDGVTEHNDAASWDRLFKFSFRCLALPKRGGRGEV